VNSRGSVFSEERPRAAIAIRSAETHLSIRITELRRMADEKGRTTTGEGIGSVTRAAGRAAAAAASPAAAIDAFVSQAKAVASRPEPSGRLVFALDATMSRQPTWDLACSLQGRMFDAAATVGGLSVQLVYFRGYGECRASGWVQDARSLTALMSRIDCRGGNTQIERVLRHVRNEAREGRVAAFVFVGDAMEENVDALCAVAGELGLLGVKGFFFQEGADPLADSAFRELARLTRGAHIRFDAAAPGELLALLRAVAAYAAGGRKALDALVGQDAAAGRKLLSQMERGR